jgi:sterol desaturase/sphingolipid hydroxylase (fatty acid hydroxylase superfamily)
MDPTIEIAARGIFAVAVFALVAAWEVCAPRRKLTASRCLRWPSNLGIVLVDALTIRLLVPAAAVGASLYAAGHGIGLLHYLNLRLSVAALLGFFIFDFIIYAQHYVFHHVPWLWRLHRMHHADLDIDVTTGFRFHPFEILISLGIKIATVLAFGIPPISRRLPCSSSRSCSTPRRCSTTPM